MDYLDDLDPDARNAFGELHEDISAASPTHEMELSTDLRAFLKPQKRTDFAAPPPPPRKFCPLDYLLKLDFPLTPIGLARTAILSTQPEIITGEGENGVAQFCKIIPSDLPKLKVWLAKTYPSFRPIFAPINKAPKELSPFSVYPTLGVDTTLPQNRPPSLLHGRYAPAQDRYPVWYFFYGTLASPTFLAQLFNLPVGQAPVLIEASISAGFDQDVGREI